jgi:trigger factor
MISMDVNVEQLGPLKKKINVIIPLEVVAEEIETIYQKLKSTVKIKGFRPGKIPKDILKRYYKEQVEGEAISRLIQTSYPEALKKAEAIPVSQPVLENGVLEEGKEFSYSASFEVKPEIELKDYLNLKAEKEKLEVTQEDVDGRLTMLRESHASLKEVEEDRPVKTGDFILTDIEGTFQGKPFEGGEIKEQLLEVGPDAYLPGLSEKLVGLRKNSPEEIMLKIPEDYSQKDLAGKEVNLKITIAGVKEKVLPALDDTFVRELGEYQGLEDLNNKIEESLKKEESQRIESSARNMIVDQLIEKNPFEVPPSMIERRIEFMMADTQRTLLSQGSSLEKLGLPLDAMKDNFRNEAEKQVKCSLLTEVIAKKESISVNDEEVEERLKEIAQSNNQDIEKIKDFYKREDLLEGFKVKLLENKCLDFLLEKATIVEVDKNRKS